MNILIVNDDGIHADGLAPLVSWAHKLGTVTVAAPKREQSGKSHGIEIHEAMEITRVDLAEGVAAYKVDSTPADCVRYAVKGLGAHYDLVLSGINRGYNLGKDLAYSGTVGAIMEASYYGINSIAISTDVDTLPYAVSALDSIYSFITENGLFAHSGLWNVNVPPSPSDIRITKQGLSYYDDYFISRGGDMYAQEGIAVFDPRDTLECDTIAVRKEHISVTPLTVIRTDFTAYDALKALNSD